MAPKGKTSATKEKKTPALTGKICAPCGKAMFSNEITTVLSIIISEAGSASKRYIHRHKKCS